MTLLLLLLAAVPGIAAARAPAAARAAADAVAVGDGGRAAARPFGGDAVVQEPLFDPARDPAEDLEAATADARTSGRRIILDVGGSWCSWCAILDRYLHDDPALRSFVADHYVWLRVNFSPENRNEAFLSRYPPIQGYPHLFVLDSDGELLHSQDTAALEQGRSYDAEKMWAFLRTWAEGSGS